MKSIRRGPRHSTRLVAILAAVLAAAGTLAACTSPVGGQSGHGSSVVLAQSGVSTDYIFPFYQPQNETLQNVQEFQALMYRPLYWFGQGSNPVLNTSLSLADPPVWTNGNRTATVHLKAYSWSDGTKLTPRNVALWLGFDRTEKKNWAYYAKGSIPDDLASVSYDDQANTVTFNLTSAVAPTEFTDAELGQIVPMPLAWDRTASDTKGSCSSEQPADQSASCPRVYSYLTKQAANQPGYANSPLWGVVDGPYTISTFTPGIGYTMKPNKAYSGPTKPTVSQLKFQYFTSDAAEYNALRSGSVDVGYIPSQDLPAKTTDAAVGKSPISGYTLSPQLFLGFYYLLINFNNPSAGPLFHQLYIRQALQSVVDQNLDITKANRGYGFPQYGPIATQPASPFASPAATQNPYPFSTAKAKQLLQSHGWAVPGSGTAVCRNAGSGANQCGAGIAAGKKLEFKLETNAGNIRSGEIMQQLTSDASAAGISIKQINEPGNQLVNNAVTCTAKQASCDWQLINYGSSGYPSPYPSGLEYFGTGSSENIGSYSDPTMDKLIAKTLTTADPNAMFQYEDYASHQIPVLWQPFYPFEIAAISHRLHGATPLSPLQYINPENWTTA